MRSNVGRSLPVRVREVQNGDPAGCVARAPPRIPDAIETAERTVHVTDSADRHGRKGLPWGGRSDDRAIRPSSACHAAQLVVEHSFNQLPPLLLRQRRGRAGGPEQRSARLIRRRALPSGATWVIRPSGQATGSPSEDYPLRVG
jgi:hypothetical protein